MNADIARAAEARVDYRLLGDLLRKPNTQTSLRVFTALRWFNAANNEANDDTAAIINLSIAFEALLSLPNDEKTERFTDAISLLLGRKPRLDIWARQFYDVRSKIVHEGRTEQLRFVPMDSRKKDKNQLYQLYQSLLPYGRQIFQLCLGTLLVGAELAEEAGLEETLITNQERFQKICKVLSDEETETHERLECIAPIVAAIKQYQYVPESESESDLQLKTMLGTTCLAAQVLLNTGDVVSQDLKEHFEQLINAKRTDDHFQKLEALQALDTILTNNLASAETSSGRTVRNLVKFVWLQVFMLYYSLKKHHSEET